MITLDLSKTCRVFVQRGETLLTRDIGYRVTQVFRLAVGSATEFETRTTTFDLTATLAHIAETERMLA